MPAQKLTEAFVRDVKLPKKTDRPNQTIYFDTLDKGVALTLTASYGGSKTFGVLTYDSAGKAQRAKLGKYPAMTVKAAKKLAREKFEDPKGYAAKTLPESFGEVAANWLKRKVHGDGMISAPEITRILTKYILPRWRDRKLVAIEGAIDRATVSKLLDEIEDKHGAAQADAVLAVVRSVLVWHQSRTNDYTSPIVSGMKRNKNKEARDRTLDDNELRAVWRAAEGAGQFGAFVRLALLTAQRKDKLRKMRWADVDFETGVWNVPAEKRSKGTGGALKLPEIAIDVIKSLPREAGNPYVFFAGGGKRYLNNFSRLKDRFDEALPTMERWTIHDLRRTARTLMTDAGVQSDHAERVLGHAIPGVKRVYDRSKYFEPKAEALRMLASKIQSIVDPQTADNVVALR